MIKLIVACDKFGGIGINGKLPWSIPEDLKHFKEMTTGHPVVMGRGTFESIKRVLPNRENIILTRHPKKCLMKMGKELATHPDLRVVNKRQLNEYLANNRDEKDIFIIGGGSVYALLLPMVDEIYLTKVDDDFDCDTYFNIQELSHDVWDSVKVKDLTDNASVFKLTRK